MARLQFFARILTIALVLATSVDALAFPITSRRNLSTMRSFRFTWEQGFHFPGIVALSNCSGSFVRFKNSKDTDRALVLTNGHCVGGVQGGDFLLPGEVLFQFPRRFKMNLLNERTQVLATVTSEKIIYATMTATDVALLELTQTYREIIQATKSQPLILSDVAPQIGTPIEVASGYWKRTYSCAIEAVIPMLKEDQWTFHKSLRYSPTGCDIIGGTSGSPVINTKTAEVIAINNTSNEDGAKCAMNNPCEVDKDGKVQVIKGRGYAQQTFVFYSCLTNTANRLDLSLRGCLLPKPQAFRFR